MVVTTAFRALCFTSVARFDGGISHVGKGLELSEPPERETSNASLLVWGRDVVYARPTSAMHGK